MGGVNASRRTLVLVLTLVGVLVVAAGAVVGLGAAGQLPGESSGRPAAPVHTPSPTPTAVVPAPAVLQPPASDPATPAVPDIRLARILRDPALGPSPRALVIDEATGAVLFDRTGSVPAIPASTAKLVTCTAALLTMGPRDRLTTEVVHGSAPGDLVLVGAGDESLTLRPAPAFATGARPASLTTLAARTATALRAGGQTTVRVHVDDSLFEGPSVSPDWESGYVSGGVVSPVSALAVDHGRVAAGSSSRDGDPARAAGADFAALLRARGLNVQRPVQRATAPAGATRIAAVRSPALGDLVAQTLSTSDNDMAEALGRLAAHAAGHPASFTGLQQTLTETVSRLGLPAPGLRLLDGSGLSRQSRLAPVTLAALVRTAVGDARLGPIVSGLPVARFSGSLYDRFDRVLTAAGAGLVRAKTGTLTGVSGLAGLADDGTGHPVVFAVMTDRLPPPKTLDAREALDRFAATLAR